MKLKKTIAASLFVILLLCPMGALSDTLLPIEKATPVSDSIGLQAGTEVVVATTTSMSGYFATDLFGSNTADMDVRALLHGYSTIAWTADGMAVDATVVESIRADVQADGNRVYTLSLSSDLCYSDGTPITAKDYVFSLLLSGSPVVTQLGGTALGLEHILGYDQYSKGESAGLSGLKLLSDHEFSIRIGAAYENYFYGLMMLYAAPLPMHIIAPDCGVQDDGDGAYITGPFGADLLRETLLNPETGYVFNPRVTSGPYRLESYDRNLGEARFAVNDRYLGNFEGQKPHIERIVVRSANAETMIRQLENGEIDLLNKVTGELAIGGGLSLVHERGGAQMDNYLRTGFAHLSFACEDGVTKSALVRRAIASTIDNKVFTASAVGEASAMPVYGYYGLGQWMTMQTFEAQSEDGLGELDVPSALSALDVPYDLRAAEAMLMEDGWTLNEAGKPFERGVDTIRHREENGEMTQLLIRWAKSEDSPISDALERALEAPFAELGIKLEVVRVPFAEMLLHYYRQTERKYDMFFLANNFGYVFDPYYDFNTEDIYQGEMNTTGLKDEQLMDLALQMSATHPMEIREYTEKWLAFQRRFVELMPMVPLYSNVYFDFYSNALQNYNIQPQTGWAQAILYAWIGEPVEEEPALEDEAFLFE